MSYRNIVICDVCQKEEPESTKADGWLLTKFYTAQSRQYSQDKQINICPECSKRLKFEERKEEKKSSIEAMLDLLKDLIYEEVSEAIENR